MHGTHHVHWLLLAVAILSISATPAESQPPLPAQAALETGDPCVRDEHRLVRLRSNPAPDEIASFQRELGCPRLRAQVQRLFESYVTEPRSTAPVATAPAAAAPANAAPKPTSPPQVQAQAAPAEDPCVRDVARLAQLRTEPNADAIARFERELGCERIRPQLKRLRESLGL